MSALTQSSNHRQATCSLLYVVCIKMKYTLFNEGNIFTGQPEVSNMALSPIELEFRNVGFRGDGKPENLENIPSEQSKEPTTNFTQIWPRVMATSPESNPGHIGGRGVQSSLHYPGSPVKLQKHS